MKKKFILIFFGFLIFCAKIQAQIQNNSGSDHANKFEQLGTVLPTPNEQRTASGAPGAKYWQQRVDYNIKCELDEAKNKLTGSEVITYFNNSPETLTYYWMHLDEKQHRTENKEK